MFDQESLSAARRRQSEERFVLFVALCSVALAFLMSEYTASAALILYGAALLLFIGVVPGTLDLVAALERSLIVHWARLGLISRSNGVLERLRGVAAVYIDPVVSEDPGVISVVSLELLDDRIGRAALCATLSSIVGRGEDELFTALATFCQRQAGEVLPDRVIELREYEGQGMCGAIRGVEFSIGSEEFLMDRGIMLQPSDALAAQANQRVLYAAIDDDVVARFRLRSGRSDLVAPAIWPSRIVTVSTYDQTAPVSNSSLVIRAELTPAPQGVDPVSVVLFDGERFEFPAADFVMLSPDVAVLPAVIETTHAVRRTERVLDAVVYSLGALGIVAVFFGFGSALLAALLWVAATWLTARQVKAVARLSVPIGN
jgi:cation transport ATPase